MGKENIRLTDSMKMIGDQEFGEGEKVGIRQVLYIKGSESEDQDIVESEGCSLLSAININPGERESEFNIAMVGSTQDSVNMVGALLESVVAKINALDDPIHKLIHLEALKRGIMTALESFDLR